MKKLLSLFIVAALSTGCSKKDSAPSRKDMLASGSWHITAATTNGVNSLQTCLSDNTYYFISDGSATQNNGATICTVGGDPNIRAFFFSNGDNTLTWQYTSWPDDTYTIKTASANQFVLDLTYTNAGVNYVYEVTLTKI